MATHPRRQYFGLWRVLTVVATASALLVAGLTPAQAETPTPQELIGTGSVIGVVTDEGGAPVEGVDVAAFPWNSTVGTWDDNSGVWSHTGPDGRFAIEGLPAGRYTISYMPYLDHRYLSMWWGNHLWKADAEGFDVVAGDPPFDASATLILGGTISGVVTARGGGGLAYARVEITGDHSSYREIYADDQGSYSVSGLAPRSYTVHFKAPQGTSWIDYWWDQADSWNTATPIQIELGTVVTGVNGVLAAPSSISGRLVDTDGSPVAGMSVVASVLLGGVEGSWTTAGSRKSAADGTFTIGGLRPGRYRLQILPPTGVESEYAHQWWSGTSEESEAEIIDVPAEETVAIGDATLLKVIGTSGSARLSGISPGVGDQLAPAAFVDGGVAGLTRSRQWFRDGVLIPGVTGSSYVVQLEDFGTRISTREDLTAPGYLPVSVDLGQTEPVGLGSFEVIENLRAYGGAEGPGLTLNVWGGHLEPEPTHASYQWLRNGVAISGQTASTYVTTSDDFGSRLSVVVTVTAPGYKPLTQTLEYGQACYRESDVPPPVIVGERAAGSTLSVAPLPGPPDMVLKYQWWLGSPIPGETAPTLKLKKAYAGYPVMLTLTRTVPGCPQLASHSSAWGVPKTTLASTPKVAGVVARRHTLAHPSRQLDLGNAVQLPLVCRWRSNQFRHAFHAEIERRARG